MDGPCGDGAVWKWIAGLIVECRELAGSWAVAKIVKLNTNSVVGSNRAVLRGILFVLQSGIPWEMLPSEMGGGCGMTCWRRLQAWQQAGVWQKLHHVLLNRLGQADQIDWSRAAIDAASVAAPGGTKRPGRIRRITANRTRNAIWWSMPKGIPLAVKLTAANVNDVTMLEATVDAIPPIRHPCGRPRRRPAKLHADKGYEGAAKRRALRARGIVPRIARRRCGIPRPTGTPSMGRGAYAVMAQPQAATEDSL